MGKTKINKIISQKAERTLEILGNLEFCKKFYLAGGTALAIQIEHRTSVDLDFFSAKTFNSNSIFYDLKKEFGDSAESKNIEIGRLFVELNGIETSFINYDYPMLSKNQMLYHGVKLANIKDIAAMKISAIIGRSAKRDLIDIYYLIKNKYGLDEMIRLYYSKYKDFAADPAIIYKSMTFFDVADTEPTPHVFENISWKNIKSFIMKETVRVFSKKIM